MNQDAVGWHGTIAHDFDAKYATSLPFTQRLSVWEDMIERYRLADSEVLDAGCGSGVLSEVAARSAKTVDAFDPSVEMAALAEARRQRAGFENMRVQVGRIGDDMLLAGRRFDLILCSSVLEYVDDYWQSIDWLAAALKPAGVLIVSMPNATSLYRTAERAIFRLTGRPGYYRFVRHLVLMSDVQAGLVARSLQPLETHYYSSTPLLSILTRLFGGDAFSHNLFAIACRRS
jgi:2-polyprenyl-6-hydroxyphenyl methylase/3-demethylubiquinone-9 3-methyltransferase